MPGIQEFTQWANEMAERRDGTSSGALSIAVRLGLELISHTMQLDSMEGRVDSILCPTCVPVDSTQHKIIIQAACWRDFGVAIYKTLSLQTTVWILAE